MARLIGLGVAITLLCAAPANADNVSRWQPYISEASLHFGIPEDWIVRVMRAESGGQTQRNGKPIRSRVGAIGLMQIMPGTWTGLTARYQLGSNPDDPRFNILGGTAYLREMYDQFGYPGLFAAYNAGPARYAAYAAGHSLLPRETIAYVASITGSGSPAPVAPAVHVQSDPSARLGRGASVARIMASRDKLSGYRSRRGIIKARIVRLGGKGLANAHSTSAMSSATAPLATVIRRSFIRVTRMRRMAKHFCSTAKATDTSSGSLSRPKTAINMKTSNRSRVA